MQVHRFPQSLPVFRRAVVTIGTFDGVHAGHRQIIDQLTQEALSVGGESVIITFHPHPRRVVGGQQSDLRLINSLHEKMELLGNTGVDHVVIVPFTEAFANQSAIEYVEHFLVAHFRPHTIIIGYDHHFGRNREGNYQLLEALKDKFGYQVKEIPEKILHNITVSSTKIRQALLNGQVKEASEFLGYDYFLEGTVVVGKRLGRTLGYPTANLRLNDPEKLVPANGVYAVAAGIQPNPGASVAPLMGGMLNIGVRPTVDGTSRTIEVHLFDFDGDLYDKSLRIFFYHRLRGEVRFEGLEGLKKQLAADEQQSRKLLPALFTRQHVIASE